MYLRIKKPQKITDIRVKYFYCKDFLKRYVLFFKM